MKEVKVFWLGVGTNFGRVHAPVLELTYIIIVESFTFWLTAYANDNICKRQRLFQELVRSMILN